MTLERPIQGVLECPGALVYNEASEGYLGHQEVCSEGFYLILRADLNYFEA